MNHLRETLSQYWQAIQGTLFPWLQEELGPLTAKQQQLVATLDMLTLERYVGQQFGYVGRPPADRVAIARAFVAKATYNMSTTRTLLDRLETDIPLRRLCGWEKRSEIPSESSFSRAFDAFAQSQLPQRIHEALVKQTHQDRLVGHIARDSTAIEAREKPVFAAADKSQPESKKKKRGRPKQGEEPVVELTRLQKQTRMSLAEMLADLPKHCNVGTKKNSKGYKESWTGYKLHLDVADGQIPVSCILTSASLHDSQVAIPLATQTHARTTNLYDLMDAAYDVQDIRQHSLSLGHVPIIDVNPRRNEALKLERQAEQQRQGRIHFIDPTQQRYQERTAVERVNARLKDEFGGKMVRVRGHAKVSCHLMFGILALTVDQLMRFVT